MSQIVRDEKGLEVSTEFGFTVRLNYPEVGSYWSLHIRHEHLQGMQVTGYVKSEIGSLVSHLGSPITSWTSRPNLGLEAIWQITDRGLVEGLLMEMIKLLDSQKFNEHFLFLPAQRDRVLIG